MILNSLLFYIISTYKVTRDGFRTLMKFVIAAFPLLAVPLFFIAAIGSIILNDTFWSRALEGVNFVKSTGVGGKGGFLVVYAKMNYFFPISETVFMVASLVPLKLMAITFRIVKSFFPTIN